jgi:dienelactone hydrolase
MKNIALAVSVFYSGLFLSAAHAGEKVLTKAQQKKFVSAATRYLALKFTPGADAKRAKLLEELRAYESFSWKGLRKAFKKAKPVMRPFKKKSGIPLQFPPPGLEKCEYILNLPRGYSPAKAWPLALLLHGGGREAGHGSQINGLLGPSYQKRGCIVVAPTHPANRLWSEPISETFILAILDEVAASYNVDFDRIYVAGHSFGGCGAWSFGTRFPDLFAGFGPAAGTPQNVMDYDLFHNTPFYVAHGTTDTRVVPDGDLEAQKKVEALEIKPRAYVFDFYVAGDAIGHGFPRKSIEAMATFLTKHTRDMFVKRCVCSVPFAQVKEGLRKEYHCFWLGVDEHPAYHAKAVGERADGNLLRIATEGTERISVFVSDDYLDLSQPVVVEVNGRKVFENKVTRSAEFLVKHMEETHDRGRVFANRIRVP